MHVVPKGKPVFFHLGSMDWLPNEEGVRWLLSAVWPRVLRKRPDARLDLAGIKMPDDLMALDMPGLQVKGRVKDALKYIGQRQVMLVPLFSAGGMRVKIVEGMAMGKAVVATPIGAEGIEVTDGRDILLARNATEFVDHIVALHDAPQRIEEIGAQARNLVADHYSDARIVGELIAFYQRLLKA